jgi:cytochrome P450 PksS
MTTTMMPKVFSAEFHTNPYPIYAYLREHEPVTRVLNPSGNPMWLITRYDDAMATLKDNRFSKMPLDKMNIENMIPIPAMLKPLIQPILKPILKRTFGPMSRNMLDLDDPDHSRLKNLVHKGFTPRLIATMQNRIEAIVDGLLNKAEAKGEMEFIADFAFPLPITVIAEILGVPEQDHMRFKGWSQTIIESSGNFNIIKVLSSVMSFNSYLRNLIKEKRVNPQDDLLSALIQAEESGDMLSEDELLGMAVILMVAGHETTVNLLSNGLLALLQNPDQLAMLRYDPNLIKNGLEELLRYDSPVTMATERYATEELSIGGMTIAKGDLVIVGIGSANRDPNQFENADSLNICREQNRHLAFGQGIHYCLGAPLARMEGYYAFNALLERFPNLKLGVNADRLEWRKSVFIRGMKTMPVTF